MENQTEQQLVNIKIDGEDYKVPRGTSILKIARERGINIPSLCYHEEVSNYGVCRLCLVEVQEGRRKRIREACTFPALEGIEVFTKSDKILHHRKIMMEMILAKGYSNPVIRKMAADMGVTETRFVKSDDPCILCGLCVRTCEEIVGVNALGFIDRGAGRKVGTPFNEASKSCIGCGACATICPAECILMTQENGTRKIWGKEFEMKACEKCGVEFATVAELDFIKKETNLPDDNKIFHFCSDCR